MKLVIGKEDKTARANWTFPANAVLWTSRIAAVISLVLLIVLFFSYLIKPDSLAALTFFPLWMWGLPGIVLALLALLYKKSTSIIIAAGWIGFVVFFAEEPKSLIRGCFASMNDQSIVSDEKTVTVISLNCAGGNVLAVRETIPYHPDIVLLQEAPTQIEDLKSLAGEVFSGDGVIAYGPDCVVLAKGELEQIPLPKLQNIFMTQARVHLKSGIQMQVFSIRLKPPVINANLFSAECWRQHTQDRISRRRQINQIIEQLNPIAKECPVILGGDFNVGAEDGCLELLGPRLKDTFSKGGVGWGHTAINSIPLFRVDQVWANSHFKAVSVISKKTINSDHRMVICKLKIQ